MSTTFIVQLNGGEQHELTTRTGLYGLAAAAAVALFDVPELPEEDRVMYGGHYGACRPIVEAVLVKIWVPSLVPPYGPYYYGVVDTGEAFAIYDPSTLPEYLR